jgi:hypothetical protein
MRELVLLGKPFSKRRGDGTRVIIADLSHCLLLANDGATFLNLCDAFRRFLDNFIAEPIPYICRVAAFVVADVISERHENGIIVHLTGGILYCDELVYLSLENENACLNVDAWLEGIAVKVDAGEDAAVTKNPFAHVAETGRAQYAIRQHDGHAPGAGFKQPNATLDEEALRWL